MAQGIIYSIYCKETDRHYISHTTKQLNKEWKEHLEISRRMSPKPLYRHIRKYGADKFSIKVLEECNESLLEEKVSYWISRYEADTKGYNDKKKIESPSIVEDTKIEEPIVKPKPKPKIKRPSFGNGKHFKRKVKAINIDTQEETYYDSINECAEALNTKPSNVSRCIKNGWRIKGHRIIKVDARPKGCQIYALDRRTNQLRFTFNSINEAVRELGNMKSESSCRRSLMNPNKYTWRECYWFYVHPNNAPPTAAPMGTDQA